MEMAVFPVWQKSSDEEKEKIARKLGRRQAEMILEEIKIQCSQTNN